jgi:uncharacterized protein (DUF305 family)
MKINPFILAFGITFFAACSNESDTAGSDSDTASSGAPVSRETGTSTTADTSSQGNSLNKAMDDMMSQMRAVQMTGDFDIDFANMMIAHHQGGIDLANVEISDGTNEKLKSKAQEIISKQNKEQQELRDFVSSYKASGMKHGEGDLQKSMSAMMDKMKSMQISGNVDTDFANMMISHHEDGIAMSRLQLKHGMDKKLKDMATKGIEEQQKDIIELRSLLQNGK